MATNVLWQDSLAKALKEDEGLMLWAYPDPLSKMAGRIGRSGVFRCGTTGVIPTIERSRLSSGAPWTIGYGSVKPWVKFGAQITEDRANELLASDIQTAVNDAKALVGSQWDNLNGVRKAVLANMSFNLGYSKLGGFKNMLASVKEGNYKDAALHMTQSLWAKQVKSRADRLIKQMLTGKWE